MSEGEAARPRVVLTRRWPAAVEGLLAERFDAVFNTEDRPMSRADLAEALASADAVCPTVTDALDADLLGTPGIRARLLANFGVGFNHIDLEAASAAGIAVTNSPGVLTDCTADLAMTLISLAVTVSSVLSLAIRRVTRLINQMAGVISKTRPFKQ